MHVVRKELAPPYDAPGHAGMSMRYLQGRGAGPCDSLWLGLSTIEPGGGTTLSASDMEKVYVVLAGELEVAAQIGASRQVETLFPLDSCRIGPAEARQLTNRSDRQATVLLVMPEKR